MIASARTRALSVAALAAAAAAFLLPQLWLFSLSLKSKAGVYEYPPRWIPDDGSLGNYVFALTRTQVPWYLWNSAVVALVAATATLAASIPAAYVLSRERFRGRTPLMAALLAVQMVSPVILLVPIYGVVERLGLIDTRTGLILVYAAMQVPFTVWVLKNFFDAVPPSIFEAARLDGASRARTLWTIVLPIVAPGLGATAIFNLAAYWSEFSLALVLLDSQERFTMPLGLFSFQSAYETDWQLLAAASFIALLPVLAAFVLLQRFFVAGLTAGAVKG
jgi:multiple sugar transport system permease protein